jgi:hypothetical protein
MIELNESENENLDKKFQKKRIITNEKILQLEIEV